MGSTQSGKPDRVNRHAQSPGGVKFFTPATVSPPFVRLALVASGTRTLSAVNRPAPENQPSFLVSFFYLGLVRGILKDACYRDWVMDSGAFSAHQSGDPVNLTSYMDEIRRCRVEIGRLTEVFALDVIGDWKASLKNTESMWKAGIEAIPCYHYGEPWDVLKGYARDYPKVALGGCARKRKGVKLAWARNCFARVWPKKLHGFGFGAEEFLRELPFHSVDATSWELRSAGFGSWCAFPGMPGCHQHVKKGVTLTAEVDHYLKIERAARSRWATEMAKLETN